MHFLSYEKHNKIPNKKHTINTPYEQDNRQKE